ncbi:OLC1v1030783C1 [Oldenlandia corymbosa var. corymbosa]|uniref:Glutathione S-transferase n=1 Tax=Oldenlandia corymbosa var. corymbosa TaxID=529605 RepID=A0AAV1CHK0_OLDCO|nr:OLC1v1030783C1 [Oldenlandia corymbosa var. corymbosa]
MAASTGDDVKLLATRVSPFVNRVQLAFNLKSVNYEFLMENLADKSELLLISNPVHEKVPVLIHDHKPICDSLAILEYIDESFPYGHSILPSDPYDRATARFWAAYIDDKETNSVVSILEAQTRSGVEWIVLQWFAVIMKWIVLEKLIEGLRFLEEALLKSSCGKGSFWRRHPGYLDIRFRLPFR